MDSHRIKQNRRTAKAQFIQIKADGYQGGYGPWLDAKPAVSGDFMRQYSGELVAKM